MDLRSLVRDFCALVGVALTGYGCWLAWAPLGFIVSGALLLILALAGEFISRYRRTWSESR